MSSTDLPSSDREAFWSEHITQWKASGLSRAKHSRQAGISTSQFFYRLNKREPSKAKSSSDFVPVSTAKANTATEFGLQLPDGRLLQWRGEVSPGYIAALCRGLC